MSFDEQALSFQRTIDRLIRRLRRGDPPVPTRRRLLIVQIDGLSRAVLEHAWHRDACVSSNNCCAVMATN